MWGWRPSLQARRRTDESLIRETSEKSLLASPCARFVSGVRVD
jgi:hypothetical protein